MPPSTSSIIGAKRQRQLDDNDAAQKKAVGQQFRNKRQKLCNAISVGSCLSSPSAAPSKCTPFALPVQQQQDKVPNENGEKREQRVSFEKIGPYRLLAYWEDNPQIYTAVDTRKNGGQLVLCRRLDRTKYAHMMQLSHRLQADSKAVSVDEEEEKKRAYEQVFPATSEVIVGEDGQSYYFEPRHYGSLHALVAERKRLNEQECVWYFRQIVRLLVYCHRRGVVVRDLKLRKFVFVDPERTTIRLDGMDELFVCPSKHEDGYECTDRITDRHGCPAYVGPELLDLSLKTYSGRAADMWSLGVLLFVTLYGRYPFYDKTPARLFAKIRHANIQIGDECGVSFEARTLIRHMLRRDPEERPSAIDLMAHPWLQSKDRVGSESRRVCGPIAGAIGGGVLVANSAAGIRYLFGDRNLDNDQCVPCVRIDTPRKCVTKAMMIGKEARATNIAPTVPEL